MLDSPYTPDHIVDYIVQNTLEPLMKNLSKDNLLQLSILDPAMGSGHFLLGVIRFIEDKILEVQSQGKLEHLDPTTVRWQVIRSCIYGVDLNPIAVELGKFSLWIYSAKNGMKLESLDDKLRCGNSLIDNDIFKLKWTENEIFIIEREINPFDYRSKFKEIFVTGGFSAIVSNPPYVFARSKSLSIIEKKYFTEHYFYQNYQANTYPLFIEKCDKLIKSSGRIGMITPNNWCSISTMKPMRNFFAIHTGKLSIININYKVFEEADVDCAIFIYEKCPPSKVTLSISVEPRKYKQINEMNQENLKYLSSFNFKESSYDNISVSIYKKIESNSLNLIEYCDVKSGFVAYEVGKGKPKQNEKMKNNRIYHSQKKLDISYRKYLEGADVCRYFQGWSGTWIKYGENLAAPRNKEIFEGVRILVRQIPNKPPYCIHACITDKNIVHDRNINIVKPHLNCPISIEFILGILNSKALSFWFETKYNKNQRTIFPQFKINEMKSFPIPKYIDEESFTIFFKSVEKIVREIMLYESNENIEYSSKLSFELDHLIYSFFGLTSKEVDWMNNWGSEYLKKAV
ncbi:MAG: hypothetical protein DCC88_03785 [Spirobacillus cienkowskii]|jgi:hypothetical protein|uniref:site-specific DNA-methyltransferase (adenine-specific) n=1 Tax=Spirobacillus cienkowskii TaxID=495820 RepID=A0A369KTI3_9BACT|nr:MAG: hypothetical protein DCC88_03785 [Spirobacillus cienkowskii]